MIKFILSLLIFLCSFSSYAQKWDYEIDAEIEKAEKERRQAYSNFIDTALNSVDLTESFVNYSQEQFRKRAIEIINDLRKQYESVLLAYQFPRFDSMPVLRANDTLELMAMKHARYLVESKYEGPDNKEGRTAHDGPDGEDCGDRAYAVGFGGSLSENIAGKFTDFTFIRAWIDSPGHRVILLHDRRSKIGISRYKHIIVMNLGE